MKPPRWLEFVVVGGCAALLLLTILQALSDSWYVQDSLLTLIACFNLSLTVHILGKIYDD